MSDPPPVPDPESGLAPETIRDLWAELDPTERDGIEDTLSALLDLVSNAHALAILGAFAFADGPLRFGDLEDDLDVTPNTLSTRLSELSDAGVLEREVYDETPPRVEYQPTEKGEALIPAVLHFHHWAMAYDI